MNNRNNMDSLILEDLMDKNAKPCNGDQADELKEHLTTLGFYREFPTPELLREAQDAYAKLGWPYPRDNKNFVLPSPPIKTKDQLIDDDVMDELDCHALETPSLYISHRMSTLVDFLLQPTESDLDKARVLTRWLARCMDEDYLKDMPRSSWSHSESVAVYLWKLRRKEMDYDELFHVLCEHAGLKYHAVKGCVRNTIKYEIGDDFREQKKTWTAVLLDGEWRLLDVRWICEAAYGVLKNNWRLIEDEKGKVSNRRAVKENRGTFKTHVRFREYYFITDPEQFVYDHFPEDERFQLLARPISYDECKRAASLRSDFFRHNLFLKSHSENIVVCDDGKLTFVIGMKEKKSMSFVYKLYRSKGNKETADSNTSKLDRYVFLERDMDEWEIRATIRCPSVGRFLFELHGSETKETHHALLVTYIIECTGINYDVKPLPPNLRQEWGPGEDTKEMGMVALTHKKGEVEADDGDAEIKFDLQKDLEFKHDLIRGEKDEPVSNRHIMHTVENGQMAINLRLPEPGEYSLNVLAKEKHKKTRFAPACSYLVSCADEPLQTREFPEIENGNPVGPNEKFVKLGFSEEDPWPSFINNLVTGEFRMHIKRPKGHYVFAKLLYEEGLKSEPYDNYVMCDTQDDTVTITCIFPKHGSFKLSIYTRTPNMEEELIYVKIIDVVLPTLTGMPSPIVSEAPEWCTGYRLKAPRHFYLLAHENQKISVLVPEAKNVIIKNHPECQLQQTDGGFWEGYFQTGSAGSIVELMAIDRKTGVPHAMFTYEVVTKEDSLQIEMKQEQLFQKALDELKTMEEERNNRLSQRMHQAIKDKNKNKLQKMLARMKEANSDKLGPDIASGEIALMELVAEEEKDLVRKELRKFTRACDKAGLIYAIDRFQRLKLREEDNDLTSAKAVLKKMGGYIPDKESVEELNKTQDRGQQTATPPPIKRDVGDDLTPIHVVTKKPGLHIYVTQDTDPLPKLDFSTVAHKSTKDASQQTPREAIPDFRIADTSTPRRDSKRPSHFPPKPVETPSELARDMKVPSAYSSILGDDDDDVDDGVGDFSLKAVEDALRENEVEENISKVKDMVRENMRSASRLHESETLQHAINDFKRLKLEEQEGDLSFAEDQLENLNLSRDATKKHWQKKTMDVFKRYWKNMKERSENENSLNDEIEHEVQKLKNMNTVCRKMAKAAQTIGRNWDNLIESEQSFHEILNGLPELNSSFCEDLNHTSDLQNDVITAEVGMKAAFDEMSKSLDQLCANMIKKADSSTRELETARLDMERDSALNNSRTSEKDRIQKLAMKTTYFALRKNILDEIKAGNQIVEEEIHQKLSELQRKMAEFHATGTSSQNNSMKDFMNSWKI